MKNKNSEKQTHISSKKKPTRLRKIDHRLYYIALAFILVISFIIYLPVFHCGFVNWDDDQYILENGLIQSINLHKIFSTNVVGNYHPLTMLLFAIEYKLFGLNATGYHAVNLFIHLLNTVLACRLVLSLSNNYGVALIASLLFGIHPMHVESVAWISELKDLLYTFFFLISFIYYVTFVKNNKKIFYFLSLLFFLPALLSKAMAASLPVALLLADYFLGRKINFKVLAEKIPFLLIAVFFGVVAIFAQKETGAITDNTVYPIAQRIIFASYSYINYLEKIIFPLHLSAFYPYPVKGGTEIPVFYYLFPFILLFFIGCVIYSIRSTKKIIFAIGFFTTTIFLVLQLLPVGQAMMADRYSYLPSLGLFYIAGEGAIILWDKKYRVIISIFSGVLFIFFTLKTYQKCETWKSSMTLWNDVINQYQTIAFTYNSRGVLFDNSGEFEKAYSDYSKAIELKPDNSKAYNNRGNLLMKSNRFADALKDYSKSIELVPKYFGAYENRGNAYTSLNITDSAYLDYSKAIELEPGNAQLYYYRGNLLKSINKFKKALQDYNKAIEIRPAYPEAFFNRALLFMNTKQNDNSMNDFNYAIQLKPDFIEAYMNRGNLLLNENKVEDALKDYDKALNLQPRNPTVYYNRGNLFGNIKRFDDAIKNFSQAILLKNDYALAYFGRGITYYNMGKKDLACPDILQAAKLGFPPAKEAFDNLCH